MSSTLIIPGYADKTFKRISTMKYPKDTRALRRAEALYDAWLSFYRGDIEHAQEKAVRLFEEIGNQETKIPGKSKAKESPAHVQKLGAAYLICCLARYGIPHFRIDAATAYMRRLKESSLHCAQAAAIDLVMHEMSIGIMSDIPGWIKNGEFGVGRVGDRLLFCEDAVYPENIYAAVLAAVQYRNYHGDYMKSLSIIDTAQKVYGMRSVIIGDVYFEIYRALNLDGLGFPEEADIHLHRAVQLVKKDALWLVIAEFIGASNGRLLSIVEEDAPEGAERCKNISNGFFDRIRRTHDDEKGRRGFKKLTDQELLVMQMLSEGRRSTDVARELCIEPGTVKYHKMHAAQKLGIPTDASPRELKEALEHYITSAVWMS
ncbi:MAG: helix-turn-helix transcriptional regulator [Lachnospiraceae bacterium]|nr:helix-turn-helix transcriptional regulator [Lachnospiraceae bacterium]